jgi:hypothetical protein
MKKIKRGSVLPPDERRRRRPPPVNVLAGAIDTPLEAAQAVRRLRTFPSREPTPTGEMVRGPSLVVSMRDLDFIRREVAQMDAVNAAHIANARSSLFSRGPWGECCICGGNTRAVAFDMHRCMWHPLGLTGRENGRGYAPHRSWCPRRQISLVNAATGAAATFIDQGLNNGRP